jgi:hypothetical protein
MGCDIHAYVEIKNKENTWTKLTLEPFDMSGWEFRSYTLFGILAGVRGSGPIQLNDGIPRGLPDDISPEVKKAYSFWEDDAHSASYITYKEVNDLYYQYTKLWSKHRDDDDITIAKDLIKSLRKLLKAYLTIASLSYDWDNRIAFRKTDIRMVFWFDN